MLATGENPLREDELARAARFHFERDGRRFAETRIALRKILSRYISIDPREIGFSYQEHGKPEISESQNHEGVRFNVSHSGRFAMIGVMLNRRIGVDVEKYRDMEFLEIAGRYFSEREYSDLKAAPARELEHYFFSCWTRKEALLKAIGEGIGDLLDKVSVAVDSPGLIDFRGDPNATQRWSILDVNIHPDYAGATAFEGRMVRVQQWDFMP